MIKTENLTKKFKDFTALDNVSCAIPEGCIYGMVGSNGAGKSTFLRLLCGVYRADSGKILFDGEDVYENTNVKKDIVFVPDDLYFLPGANISRMAKLYKRVYENFDDDRFKMLSAYFKLPEKRPINNFSKGMKRQAAIILALSAKPKYILLDETFDGLDPVMRSFVKSLIYDDVASRNMTTVLSSHSLRELEDICDSLVLLHNGKIVLENNISELKEDVFKVQVAFGYDYDKSLFEGLNVTQFSKQGSVSNIIVKGESEELQSAIKSKNPVLFEILPLTLEEVFTQKMQEFGYDFSEILDVINDDDNQLSKKGKEEKHDEK